MADFADVAWLSFHVYEISATTITAIAITVIDALPIHLRGWYLLHSLDRYPAGLFPDSLAMNLLANYQ